MARGGNRSRCALGIDFGTESARALLVGCADGRELGSLVYEYRHGVIDQRLPEPDHDVRLGVGWALQDPDDYVRALCTAVPSLLAETGVEPSEVVGIGIDLTSCTMLPTLADGTPLCRLDDLRRSPHSWVKLWKHHAAQEQADRVNRVGRERGEGWLRRYGGKISAEWFFPKALQLLEETPEVYQRAERLIEAGDWVVWQLTGNETRNSCAAGYKAMWSKREGFPSDDYFAALDPRFRHVVDEKMSRRIAPNGASAGGICERAAAWTGLRVGTPVAVANVDGHVSVPAVTVTQPGTMVAIMGTSVSHILLAEEPATIDGICGVVEDGVVPGLFGFEAGQSAGGDIFAWFVANGVPPEYHERARRAGLSVHEVLEQEAATLRPGASGLLALDWWNGNRSVLVDADLRGLLVGMTLATKAPEIYRALIEATAFGTRVIIDAFESAGIRVGEIVASGGLPERNKLLMQIFADVTGRDFAVAASAQAAALGSAMTGAVAGGAAQGGYDSIVDAARHMGHLGEMRYRPLARHQVVYDDLYQEYLRLHDLFGRGESVMRTLTRIQREIERAPTGRAREPIVSR